MTLSDLMNSTPEGRQAMAVAKAEGDLLEQDYDSMTDADFGEFDGKAICRDCGGDLDPKLTAFEIEYCPPCAGYEVDEDGEPIIPE